MHNLSGKKTTAFRKIWNFNSIALVYRTKSKSPHGPIWTTKNYKWEKVVLCMTDAFTKYIEVTVISNKEAPTVAEAVFNQWICRHGTPIMLLSDEGKEFCNTITEELCKLMGIKKSRTSRYHPQCNSQVEVVNKHVAKYLGDFVSSDTLDWEALIPAMAFAYSTSTHRTTMNTSFSSHKLLTTGHHSSTLLLITVKILLLNCQEEWKLLEK